MSNKTGKTGMFWVAIEYSDTCEISEFEPATDEELLDLLDDYKVDKRRNPMKFRVGEREHGQHVVYDGVIYKGGFGCDLWIASSRVEL